MDEVTDFFKTAYRTAQLNQVDLKQELTPLLARWGWQGSVDEFLEYWFSTDVPDQAVLAKVKEFRDQGVVCCLATDQEKYRAQNITDTLGFGQLFDHCFYSYQLGVSKEDPEFFNKIIAELGVAPGEVVFWDDDKKNVEAAKAAGLDARFYTSLEDLKI
jgi:putative hydrolase of the HAD superfamily